MPRGPLGKRELGRWYKCSAQWCQGIHPCQKQGSLYLARLPPNPPQAHPKRTLISYWRPKADSQPGGKKDRGPLPPRCLPTPPPAGLPPCHDHNSLATHARPPVGWPTRPAPLQITPHTPGLVPADPASSAEVPFWGRVIWWCPPREAQPLPPYGGSLCSLGAAAGRPGAACLPLVQPLRTLGPARPVLAGHCCGCVIRCAGLVG
jgi:hypothetical protein